MKTTAEILDILRDFKAHYAEKYGIITLGLFGSTARGEHDETSDIDICIKLQEPNYFTIQDIKEDLEKIFRTKVDIISLGAIMRNFFKKSLEEDAIYI
jgi:predicted nucleotidyltransferase